MNTSRKAGCAPLSSVRFLTKGRYLGRYGGFGIDIITHVARYSTP